jgi:nucleoside-diphosphate-sugar epimerase
MYTIITGGLGHIGSWTAALLIEQGSSVILCDTRSTLPDALADFTDSIIVEPCDVTQFAQVSSVLTKYQGEIEGIIHTVGIMGEFVPRAPYRNTVINVNGFLNVLEAARQFGISKIVYISTGAVYGAIEGIARETEHLPQPADLYSATKTASEMLGLQYGASFDMDVRIARVYFVYGPGKLPSEFIRLYRNTFGVLEGLDDLKMERGYDQKLDFTNVKDAARGVAMIYTAPEIKRRIYNIATGRASSVGEVAALCASMVPGNTPAEIGPGTLMPRCEALSIDLAAEELGYEPQIGLQEGIAEYLEWIRSRQDRT